MATDPVKLMICGQLPMKSTESHQVKLVHRLENIVLLAKKISALNLVTIFNIRDQMAVSMDSYTLTIIMTS